jgi:F0F1-type ATP synthase assembly protein I
MNREQQERDDPDSTLIALARYSGHGLTIAVATAVFLFAGWWLDGRLGTTPLLTVLGALTGAGAGFYSMLQHVLFMPREEERRERSGEKDDEGR